MHEYNFRLAKVNWANHSFNSSASLRLTTQSKMFLQVRMLLLLHSAAAAATAAAKSKLERTECIWGTRTKRIVSL